MDDQQFCLQHLNSTQECITKSIIVQQYHMVH
jgi:hypothetical protein